MFAATINKRVQVRPGCMCKLIVKRSLASSSSASQHHHKQLSDIYARRRSPLLAISGQKSIRRPLMILSASSILAQRVATAGLRIRSSNGDIHHPSLYVMSCRMIPVIYSAYSRSPEAHPTVLNPHLSAPKSASYCGASVCDGLACRSQTAASVRQLSVL